MVCAINALETAPAGVAADRSQFYMDLSLKFFGANRKDHNVSQGMRDTFWHQGIMGGLRNQYECIKAFSETDFTEDLKKFDVPTLIIHGDDDQIVPIETTAKLAVKLIKDAKLTIYKGGPHGLAETHKEKLNADLLAFIKKVI